MSAEEKNMLGRFLRLALPKFACAPGEDTFEFLLLVRIEFIV